MTDDTLAARASQRQSNRPNNAYATSPSSRISSINTSHCSPGRNRLILFSNAASSSLSFSTLACSLLSFDSRSTDASALANRAVASANSRSKRLQLKHCVPLGWLWDLNGVDTGAETAGTGLLFSELKP